MKHVWLSIFGFMLLGITTLSASPSWAASAAGPYYTTPSWDQTMPASTRFIVLTNMPGAVLDRETGLVWEQSPSESTVSWYGAHMNCNRLNKGGRSGWRLPTIQELASLVDRTQSNPALPAGHPFNNVQPFQYWSATTTAQEPDMAWYVFFSDGTVNSIAPFNKGNANNFWCVRGGHGVDPQ